MELIIRKTKNLVYHPNSSSHLMPLLPNHGTSPFTQDCGTLGAIAKNTFHKQARELLGKELSLIPKKGGSPGFAVGFLEEQMR